MLMKMFQLSSAGGQAADVLVIHKLMNGPRKETQPHLVIFSPNET